MAGSTGLDFTDDGVAALASLKDLRKLYAANTSLTDDTDTIETVAGARYDLELDITEALRARTSEEPARVKLVAVDLKGREVPNERARIDALEVLVD